MGLFYSAVTAGFYSSQISGSNIPPDAVEITPDEHVTLLSGRRAGRLIELDPQSGRPVLGAIPLPVERDLSELEREWRDSELTAVMWLRERHRDQLEIEVETTLTAEQFRELLVYIQALRDWPQSPDFPVLEQRPAAPSWIAEQPQ